MTPRTKCAVEKNWDEEDDARNRGKKEWISIANGAERRTLNRGEQKNGMEEKVSKRRVATLRGRERKREREREGGRENRGVEGEERGRKMEQSRQSSLTFFPGGRQDRSGKKTRRDYYGTICQFLH